MLFKIILPFLLGMSISSAFAKKSAAMIKNVDFYSDRYPDPPENACNGTTGEIKFAKNPRGCAWFFTCDEGDVVYEGRCGENYRFNFDKQACDHQENVECVDVKIPIECPGTAIVTVIPHLDSCSKYTVCFQNIFNDRECPSGLHFSYYDGRCVDRRFADCSMSNLMCRKPPENDVNPIFVGHAKSCDSYFLCCEDRATLLRCAPGLQFDKENARCDTAAAVNCIPETGEDHPRIPNDVDYQPDCTGKIAQNVPHPYACEFYFFCLPDSAFLQMCGQGLLFDSISNSCQSPSNAVCAELPEPTDAPTEPPTDAPTDAPTSAPDE